MTTVKIHLKDMVEREVGQHLSYTGWKNGLIFRISIDRNRIIYKMCTRLAVKIICWSVILQELSARKIPPD